jgi:hypothetical protein
VYKPLVPKSASQRSNTGKDKIQGERGSEVDAYNPVVQSLYRKAIGRDYPDKVNANFIQ